MAGTVKKANPSIPDDLSNVEFETSEDIEVIPSFDALNLNEHLLRGIYAYGKLMMVMILFLDYND